MARIGIIGAGIVGLNCAHWLREDGHEVTVIDRDPRGDKCSWGNAGGIAAPEVVPASMPGVLRQVPRWLLDPLGPLALRPAHAPAMLPWLRRFIAAGRPARVDAISAALAAINARVHEDWRAVLAATGQSDALRPVGAITVYATDAGLAHDRAEWELRRRHGIACEELTGEAVRAMEPALGPIVRHGVLTPTWSQVTDPKVVWSGVLELAGGAGRDGGAARGARGARRVVRHGGGRGRLRGRHGWPRRWAIACCWRASAATTRRSRSQASR